MLKLLILYNKIKHSRENQEEKGTLPCLFAEGEWVELYGEGGVFSSNFYVILRNLKVESKQWG